MREYVFTDPMKYTKLLSVIKHTKDSLKVYTTNDNFNVDMNKSINYYDASVIPSRELRTLLIKNFYNIKNINKILADSSYNFFTRPLIDDEVNIILKDTPKNIASLMHFGQRGGEYYNKYIQYKLKYEKLKHHIVAN